MEGDRKRGERSPRDPERKNPTQNKNSRRDSSAESPSTYVSARVQKVTIYSLIFLISLNPFSPFRCIYALCSISYAAYHMNHWTDNFSTDRKLLPLFIPDRFSDHRGIDNTALWILFYSWDDIVY